jgi:pimeloyl-ACP methyl ester carboxylesterase
MGPPGRQISGRPSPARWYASRVPSAASKVAIRGWYLRIARIRASKISAEAFDAEATRASMARLRAPVLFVAGEYDVALPSKCAAEYAELFRLAELAVQPGGGHYPWLDDPESFVQTVVRFLH